MYQVSVLFFASVKELTGVRKITLDVPEGSHVMDLKRRLQVLFPELERIIDSTIVSVNREFAFDEDAVPLESEVALFPPVSGGSDDGFPTIIAITCDELNLDELLSRIALPTSGAACTFTGVVRGSTDQRNHTQQESPRETLSLEYEAYTPMAEAKMRQVAGEIRARFPAVQGIAMVQRVGHLKPGTPTVLISCTAAHRDNGVFEAARYGIDRLKEIVPIWKKEIGKDGETWIEGKYVPKRNE